MNKNAFWSWHCGLIRNRNRATNSPQGSRTTTTTKQNELESCSYFYYGVQNDFLEVQISFFLITLPGIIKRDEGGGRKGEKNEFGNFL